MPITTIESDPSTLTLTAIGEYPVPVERLWEAWTDPRQLERFWGPPQWPASFTRFDLEAGGRAEYHMRGPDGEVSHGYWIFERVEEPRLIELRDGFANPDQTTNTEFPTTRMRLAFESTDDGSRFVAVSTFPSVEAMEKLIAMGMEEGLAAALAQLDDVLADGDTADPDMSSVGPIIAHLWFDTEAVEAARFYADVFPDSGVDHVGQIRDTPSGDCDIVDFHIGDQPFMAISAGPLFEPNPSISFFLNFDPSRDEDALERLDATWERLADGGVVRMELGEYPFSRRYGWVEDRYGINWQLMLSDPDDDPRPFVVPGLMFTAEQSGNAEKAIELYISLFRDSNRGQTARYPAGMEPDEEGTLMFADFQLCGQWFAAMDSAREHEFVFNEAISLLVECETQDQMDRLSDALSAVPEAEQCGWLKDRFGVSWQITPAEMQTVMREGTQEQIDRVTQAFLPMKRLDVAAIRAAYEGSGE